MQCPHIEEEILERYAMGTLSGELLADMEEHFLTCSTCQARLVETDQFLRVFRMAATQVEAQPAPFWKTILGTRGGRRAGAALAMASVAVALIIVVPRNSSAPPAVVLMQGLRGPEAPAKVAAGRPSVLVFDLGAQVTPNGYGIKILNLAGDEVLSANAGRTGGQVSVLVKNLSRGSYWVRVYRNESHELAAEYALRAE